MLGEICISIPSIDFDKSREFYVHVLGFKVDIDSSFSVEDHSIRRLSLVKDDNPGIRFEFVGSEEPIALGRLSVTMQNLSASLNSLKNKFPNIEPILHSTPFGEFADCTDPSGNRIQLRQADA
jgi:catechol 2,3-dioxygenase-like lactoylglutathione lyase family enzyme